MELFGIMLLVVYITALPWLLSMCHPKEVAKTIIKHVSLENLYEIYQAADDRRYGEKMKGNYLS